MHENKKFQFVMCNNYYYESAHACSLEHSHGYPRRETLSYWEENGASAVHTFSRCTTGPL